MQPAILPRAGTITKLEAELLTEPKTRLVIEPRAELAIEPGIELVIEPKARLAAKARARPAETEKSSIFITFITIINISLSGLHNLIRIYNDKK